LERLQVEIGLRSLNNLASKGDSLISDETFTRIVVKSVPRVESLLQQFFFLKWISEQYSDSIQTTDVNTLNLFGQVAEKRGKIPENLNNERTTLLEVYYRNILPRLLHSDLFCDHLIVKIISESSVFPRNEFYLIQPIVDLLLYLLYP